MRRISYRELFVSPTNIFGGIQKDYEEADYVILGVPFDATSSYRAGARFAPAAIREASLNIETYSLRTNIDVEDLKIHDLGDLHISGSVKETLRRVELVLAEIFKSRKVPVLIGGEHTITLGALRALKGLNPSVDDVTVVSFDAHLDLREEYLGERLCHAAVMRRVLEETGYRLVGVGTRAVCREEVEYAERREVRFITSSEVLKNGVENTVERINRLTEGADAVYLTIDMDVLDPAFAPAVQNPEPAGLSINILLEVLSGICNSRVIALDLVEVAPTYDMGITAVQAARVIFEVLSFIERDRQYIKRHLNRENV